MADKKNFKKLYALKDGLRERKEAELKELRKGADAAENKLKGLSTERAEADKKSDIERVIELDEQIARVQKVLDACNSKVHTASMKKLIEYTTQDEINEAIRPAKDYIEEGRIEKAKQIEKCVKDLVSVLQAYKEDELKVSRDIEVLDSLDGIVYRGESVKTSPKAHDILRNAEMIEKENSLELSLIANDERDYTRDC